MSEPHSPADRTPDDDWADLLAGRPAPHADARTAHQAALLRHAIGRATEATSGPASAAEQQTLDKVRAQLIAQLHAAATPAPQATATPPSPAAPRTAANDAWYSPRRLALAASLVLAIGVGTLAVRTALPPQDNEMRALNGKEGPGIHSREPAALAQNHPHPPRSPRRQRQGRSAAGWRVAGIRHPAGRSTSGRRQLSARTGHRCRRVRRVQNPHSAQRP